MAAESGRFFPFPARARIAGWIVFVVVLYFGDWLTYAVSLALFRLDPTTVPDSFFIAYELRAPEPGGFKYFYTTWQRYRSAERPAIGALRLAEPSGRMPIKGGWVTFQVLEDDGERQLVEVSYDGFYRSASRYEAHADRVVPVAYRSRGWGDPASTHAIGWFGSLLLAGAAGWLTMLVATRLIRLRAT